jgi:bacteriocin-like protein
MSVRELTNDELEQVSGGDWAISFLEGLADAANAASGSVWTHVGQVLDPKPTLQPVRGCPK